MWFRVPGFPRLPVLTAPLARRGTVRALALPRSTSERGSQTGKLGCVDLGSSGDTSRLLSRRGARSPPAGGDSVAFASTATPRLKASFSTRDGRGPAPSEIAHTSRADGGRSGPRSGTFPPSRRSGGSLPHLRPDSPAVPTGSAVRSKTSQGPVRPTGLHTFSGYGFPVLRVSSSPAFRVPPSVRRVCPPTAVCLSDLSEDTDRQSGGTCADLPGAATLSAPPACRAGQSREGAHDPATPRPGTGRHVTPSRTPSHADRHRVYRGIAGDIGPPHATEILSGKRF